MIPCSGSFDRLDKIPQKCPRCGEALDVEYLETFNFKTFKVTSRILTKVECHNGCNLKRSVNHFPNWYKTDPKFLQDACGVCDSFARERLQSVDGVFYIFCRNCKSRSLPEANL